MTASPRVTIGLPVYNAEKFLAVALDSILAQTYADFVLIISDNGSTDRTAEICHAYCARDQRIRYFCNEKNLGAAPNFNRVFALASTEYFKWAPYDDLLAPEFLARCVEILDQHPTVVLCYSRAEIIDEQGNYVVDYDPGPATNSRKPAERFRNLILHPEYAIQQMGVMRSAVLKQTVLHGSYPSSDEVLLAELALRGEFYEIPDRLYLYRRHGEQSTSVNQQRARIIFFDTAMTRKITLPKWMYLFAGLGVIQRVPLDWRARGSGYLTMARWVFILPHLRALIKDVLIALSQIIARVARGGRMSE
ncbi:MAG: glycosyltransferase [Chloroflexi bacterium]|nr:glycosyltransferase [Chloroflexota bacterium]